jgi:hypothetical protein
MPLQEVGAVVVPNYCIGAVLLDGAINWQLV